MEKFLLRGVLARDELDIVHEEEVGVAVFVTELEVLAAADGVDQLVCELVALDVDDVIVRVLALDLVGDGIEQVRLAEAGLAIDEQGVIGVGGVIRDGAGGGKRVLVRRTDDEFIERILRVELDEIAVFLVLGVLRQLGLVKDDDLDLRLELVAHGLADLIDIALDDHVLAERRRRVDDELAFRQLDDLGIVKIRGDRNGRGMLLQIGKNA